MEILDSQSLSGWLNILKPPGMTSHDVVAWVRRLTAQPRSPKIGHIGTLDPAASGVLPLCVGKATRLSIFADPHEKSYTCEIVFGIETDSFDADGKIIRQESVSLSEEDILAVLPRFTGDIQQQPPKYSAIQIDGKRAYRMAKLGQEFELPTRPVTIHQLQLLDFRAGPSPRAIFSVVCSKGTYIRSICRDIGAALGCGAYLGFLSRTGVGPFKLEESSTLEELQQAEVVGALLPLDFPLRHLPEAQLDATQACSFCMGTAIEGIAPPEAEYIRVYAFESGEFIGIGRSVELAIKPAVVLASPQQYCPATRGEIIDEDLS